MLPSLRHLSVCLFAVLTTAHVPWASEPSAILSDFERCQYEFLELTRGHAAIDSLPTLSVQVKAPEFNTARPKERRGVFAAELEHGNGKSESVVVVAAPSSMEGRGPFGNFRYWGDQGFGPKLLGKFSPKGGGPLPVVEAYSPVPSDQDQQGKPRPTGR